MLFSSLDFPDLHSGNHHDTSLPDEKYNCIAWAAGDTDQWWDPTASTDPAKQFYWPANVPRDYKVTSLILALESVGFAPCADASQEDGIEKIAIYRYGDEYMHAARQLESGKWTSKMGKSEDIEHDAPENLAGPCYGQVSAFMKRKR